MMVVVMVVVLAIVAVFVRGLRRMGGHWVWS